MDVSLTPELEQIVNDRVASGLYRSADEVFREALRLLVERDLAHQGKLDALRRDLEVGMREIQEGQRLPLDAAAIKAEGRRRLDQGHRGS